MSRLAHNTRYFLYAAALSSVAVITLLCAHGGEYPDWWISRVGVNTNETAYDYSAINQGQLKWMATNAYAEFEANLRNGAGSGIEAVLTTFTPTNNYYGVNLGQLKHVAQPFYDRLSAESVTNAYPDGMAGNYPWTTATTDDVDFAMANIGQMKYVFSFDLDKDSDALPDWWEIEWWGDTSSQTNAVDDRDGDSLVNSNEYAAGTDPTGIDSDGDGVDDGTEVSEGTDPIEELPESGMNRNWLFHNNEDFCSASWELAPELWQRFLMVDYETGTNTVYMLAPPNLAMGVNTGVEAECRVSWTNLPPTNGWFEEWYSGGYYTSVVLAANEPFHGLPTLGNVTLHIYRVEWPQPEYTDEVVSIYYSPMLRTLTNGAESDYSYLVDSLTADDAGVSGYGTNNWRRGPQVYAKLAPSRDYEILHAPVRLENGGFEDQEDACWNVAGISAYISTNFAQAGTNSFLSADWGGDGLAYQNIGVHPGEEFVLSGYVLLPSTNSIDPNPPAGDRYPSVRIDYINDSVAGIFAAQIKPFTNSMTYDTWHYFAITSLVPNLAKSANISLRTESPRWTNGAGHIYFDSIDLSINPDTDKDGMPNRWEEMFPTIFDTNDCMDGILDTDGDGLINLDEYRLGISPTNTDSDADGMGDYWEVAYGFDPRSWLDAAWDSDDDGLSNVDEYDLGTNPWLADTDGDGLSDGLEALDYGTQPLTNDFSGFDLVLEINGSDTTNVLGDWETNGTHICASGRRGYLEYSISVATADVYYLEIDGRDVNDFTGQRLYELRVSMDSVYLDRLQLISEDNETDTVGFFLPWVTAGVHTIRLYWDNAAKHPALRLVALRLQSLPGDDSDADGVKDWVENRLARVSNVDTGQTTSVSSPMCLEGDDPYVEMLSLTNGSPVQHGAGDRWYADIPLDQSNSVEIVASFQSGGRIVTNIVEWTPHNLLTDATNLTIRKNDAVLFTVDPGGASGGTVDVEVVDVATYQTDLDHPVVHTFSTCGAYTVTGTYTPVGGSPTSRSIAVTALDAAFPTNPACSVKSSRLWSCVGVSDAIDVDYDPSMHMAEISPSFDTGTTFQIIVQEPEKHYFVARAGEDGPIITNAYAQGFRVTLSAGTDVEVAEVCGTGEQLIKTPLVMSPVFDGVELKGQIIVGGILYEDGSVEQEWTGTNFNALGECEIGFIRSAFSQTSFCSILDIFQGTNLVGRFSR